jgi:hypothetical protein
MCLKCVRLMWPVRPRDPAAFFDLVERITQDAKRGVLEVVQASSPLEEP